MRKEFRYLVAQQHSNTNVYCKFTAFGCYYFEIGLVRACLRGKKPKTFSPFVYRPHEVSDAHTRIARARSARSGIPLWLAPRRGLMESVVYV